MATLKQTDTGGALHMAAESYSNKILTDAKASSTTFATFGLADGQPPLDDAHTPTNAQFNTGSLYLDTAPAGSRADRPAVSSTDQPAAQP
jgi:hypothetical protein